MCTRNMVGQLLIFRGGEIALFTLVLVMEVLDVPGIFVYITPEFALMTSCQGLVHFLKVSLEFAFIRCGIVTFTTAALIVKCLKYTRALYSLLMHSSHMPFQLVFIASPVVALGALGFPYPQMDLVHVISQSVMSGRHIGTKLALR